MEALNVNMVIVLRSVCRYREDVIKWRRVVTRMYATGVL